MGEKRQASLIALLNREWFTRAWVFQEAVLPQNLLVKCGTFEVTMEDLTRSVNAVERVLDQDRGYAHSFRKLTVGYDTLELISHARQPCNEPGCDVFKPPTSFLQVLFECMLRFRATNQHDMVYAFLDNRFQSLKTEHMIIPDYTKSVEWVWTDAARRIIADTGRLDIFAAARGTHKTSAEIPSWVPDLAGTFEFGRPIYAPDLASSFDACSGKKHVYDGHDMMEFFVMPVKGKAIRKINWRSPVNFKRNYIRDNLSNFLELDLQIRELSTHISLQRRSISHHFQYSTAKEYILRTLLADGAFGPTQPIRESMGELLKIIQDEEDIVIKMKDRSRIPLAEIDQWKGRYELLEKLWRWALISQKKFLFTTNAIAGPDTIEGLNLGLAARSIEVGDTIVILYGSKVPIVLRPVDQDSSRWKVITQCYLDGWMYGHHSLVELVAEGLDDFILI